jgi:hypothetical protein
MTRAKKEIINPEEEIITLEEKIITPEEELKIVKSGLVTVTLLKTIQISPSSETLKPGLHTLDGSLAKELKAAGLLLEEFD